MGKKLKLKICKGCTLTLTINRNLKNVNRKTFYAATEGQFNKKITLKPGCDLPNWLRSLLHKWGVRKNRTFSIFYANAPFMQQIMQQTMQQITQQI